MEWSDEIIVRLRALWDEGHSTAEIGRRMGISKNAVVGKAHRLNLPARPSPIRREGDGGPPRAVVPKRVVGPTLPSLERPQAPAGAVPAAGVAPPAPAETVPARPVILREVIDRQPPSAARGGRLFSCCWPIGEPGTSSFRFCDAEAASGKPYCAEHASLAYVKVRDRREDAA